MTETTLPRHSIIVPAYNTGEPIRRCLDSILAQSSSDWELIAVDDGSSDNTGAIIDSYASRDKRIKAVHIHNAGVANARNVGIDHAKGEYVMFVDSDDWIEPDYLSKVDSQFGTSADIYMLGITLDYTANDGTVCYSEIKGTPMIRHISADDLYRNVGYLLLTMNMESSCLKSYRRSFLLEHGIRFMSGMIIFEDFHFVLSCICARPAVTLIPFIGYHYVVDMNYNPAIRHGGRDFYPSVHNLFVILERLWERLGDHSYSRDVVLRIMASKISVVTGQAFLWGGVVLRRKPYVNIVRDEVLNRHLPQMLRYGGGRFRLQRRLTAAGFPYLAYLSHKYLR